MHLSIIIPVYNGEYSIPILFNKIKDTLDGLFIFEVIFVYDCGKDNSWDIIVKLKNENPDIIKAIRLSRNFGQHNALICGFKYAKGDYIITMDEDLQHNPQDIFLLLEQQKLMDYDVVYGSYEIPKHSFFRNITSICMKNLLSIGIPDLHTHYSAFRLIKKNIAQQTLLMNNSYTFLDGYLSWITMNVSSIKVNHSERAFGKSSYTLSKLINHSINIFVTFSNLPIKILIHSSILIFVLSSIFSVYLLLRRILYNDLISGYASMMIVLGFGIGIIIFGLGIIGEYIYRINIKTTKRPNFIEREII